MNLNECLFSLELVPVATINDVNKAYMRMNEALIAYFGIIHGESDRLSIALSREFESELDDMFDNG